MHAYATGAENSYLSELLADAIGDMPAAGFEVHYQPIVRLADSAIVAVEAFPRWWCPHIGDIDPDVLVTLAERDGHMGALDAFVLDQACKHADALADVHSRAVDLHVNINAVRLGACSMEEAVARTLERYGLRPARLVLEITNLDAIIDVEIAAAALRRLRRRGVQIALDDFGTESDALARLLTLPIDMIKLNDVLTESGNEMGTKALRPSMLDLCRERDVVLIADGVQTVSHAGALAELGCQLGQGYLYGSPEPLERLLAHACVRPARGP
jgi:diguanylate cyclase